jgi:MYXO-CTERM domain-containing protein
MPSRTLAAMTIAAATHATLAQPTYVLNLDGRMGFSQSRFSATAGARYFAGLDTIENGSPTDAFITIASPNRFFRSFDNNPSGTLSSSFLLDTTQDVIDEVNGTWTIEIEETDGSLYEYTVDVGFNLPFAEIPKLVSPNLVNGAPTQTFTWTLEGGSPAFPGSGAQFDVGFFTEPFEAIDRELLDISATSWTPDFDFDSLDLSNDFWVQISTRFEAIDVNALTFSNITAITAGAPDIAFGTAAIEYEAFLQAFVEPVPGPGAIGALGAAGLVSVRRRR